VLNGYFAATSEVGFNMKEKVKERKRTKSDQSSGGSKRFEESKKT
jgi:hypothetical protein